MKSLVSEFKRIENDDERKYSTFIRTRQQKQLLMKVILMIYLSQFILQLHQTYKKLAKELDHLKIALINIQRA